MTKNIKVDIAIIGAGTSGLSAYREAIKKTDKVALIEGGEYGTTCARVGCMPSKLLIAPAEARHKASHFETFGLEGQQPSVNGKAVMDRVKRERDRFVSFTLKSIEGFEKSHMFNAYAEFINDNTLKLSTGERIEAKVIVIATGSSPFIPDMFSGVKDQIITNDDIFYMDDLPKSVAVFGTGIVGVELCQAMHRLGVKVKLYGRDGDTIGPLTDMEVDAYAKKSICKELHYTTETNDIKISEKDGKVCIEYSNSKGEHITEEYKHIMVATGRRPNLESLKLENTSLELEENGVPKFCDLSMRCGESNIFIAGDVNNKLPLLHEAADEGKIAGKNAAAFPDTLKYKRRTPLGIMFSDPQIAIVGKSYKKLKNSGVSFKTGAVDFEDQGRSRIMQVNNGLLRVYGEVETGLLLGAEMIGPAAEHIAHLIAWSIQDQKTVAEILEKPFYHPVIEEGLRTALRELLHNLGVGAKVPPHCIDCGSGG